MPDKTGAVEVWARRERRVSWTPGAEGAEVSRAVCVGWGFVGTKRRDCVYVSFASVRVAVSSWPLGHLTMLDRLVIESRSVDAGFT